MPYTRKTRDEYRIESNWGYGHGWEEVTAEESLKEGRAMLKCYRENEPQASHRLRMVRVPITETVEI